VGLKTQLGAIIFNTFFNHSPGYPLQAFCPAHNTLAQKGFSLLSRSL
jgi:hypothetical protein